MGNNNPFRRQANAKPAEKSVSNPPVLSLDADPSSQKIILDALGVKPEPELAVKPAPEPEARHRNVRARDIRTVDTHESAAAHRRQQYALKAEQGRITQHHKTDTNQPIQQPRSRSGR